MTHCTTFAFADLSNTSLYDLLALRSKIFVVEQNIVYLDPDGYDPRSLHTLMHDGERLIGCARIIPPGVKFSDAAIGRLVVDSDYRGRGLGERLMRYAIEETRARFVNVAITIEAQAHLQKFYESIGYETQTEPYMLERLMHVLMRLPAEKPCIGMTKP